jgi:Rad51
MMQTRPTIDPLQQKTWQLDAPTNGVNGYLYYCGLCDEALVCSKHLINPQKIQLAFDNACPGCGFELERVLKCEASSLPPGRRLLTNLKCEDPGSLLDQEDWSGKQATGKRILSTNFQPDLTTGIETIDRILVLKRGQLVYLQGESANALSLLFCVRAMLPAPRGLDRDVIFIDAGNLFDTYTLSQHAINLGVETEKIQGRIHLSRAFTHHQIFNLIMDKLPSALEEYDAGLAVVSDITALFCDPDVRDKRESLDIFRRSVRFIAETAENHNMIIIVTNLKIRNRSMEGTLNATAHVSASVKGKDGYTQLTVTQHPFIPEKKEKVVLDHPTLIEYSRRP